MLAQSDAPCPRRPFEAARALATCVRAAPGDMRPGAPWRRLRRGGRAAEGARLESVYAGNRIAGSNPAPSASACLTDDPLAPLAARSPGRSGAGLRISGRSIRQRRGRERSEGGALGAGFFFSRIHALIGDGWKIRLGLTVIGIERGADAGAGG